MSKKKTDELTETKDIKTLVMKISSATTISEVEKYGDMLKEAMKEVFRIDLGKKWRG